MLCKIKNGEVFTGSDVDPVWRGIEIEQVEALSKITYKNAIEFYLSRGFADGDDTEVIETYSNRIQKYLTLLHN